MKMTKILRECDGAGSAPATSVGATPDCSAGQDISGYDIPISMATRKKFKEGDKYAQSDVYEVDYNTFEIMREAKMMKWDWKKKLSENTPDGQKLLAHIRNSTNSLFIVERWSGRILFLEN